MQLRAQVVGKDSMIDSLKIELEQLRESIPDWNRAPSWPSGWARWNSANAPCATRSTT
jgi:hypothetical protein